MAIHHIVISFEKYFKIRQAVVKKIFSDRNFLLIFALLLGFIKPEYSLLLKDHVLIILGILMTMSFTAFSTKAIFPIKQSIKAVLTGIFLNHILFGFFIGIASLFFINDTDLFYGFIVIIATPPGAAIIPFTAKLDGNLNLSVIGTLGAFIASIIFTPLILGLVTTADMSPSHILEIIVYLILIPFIISRFLIIKKAVKIVHTLRGYIIDIGFALIIYISIGMNSDVFYNNFYQILSIVIVFVFIMFVLTKLYGKIMRNKFSNEDIISHKLLLTVKSSGFAIVLAMDFFNDKAAIPATIMGVILLFYLLSLVFTKNYRNKN